MTSATSIASARAFDDTRDDVVVAEDVVVAVVVVVVVVAMPSALLPLDSAS